MRHECPRPVDAVVPPAVTLALHSGSVERMPSPSSEAELSALLTIACESLAVSAALLWSESLGAPLASAGPAGSRDLAKLAARAAEGSEFMQIASGTSAVRRIGPAVDTRFFAACRLEGSGPAAGILCVGGAMPRTFGTAEMSRLRTFAQTFAALLRDRAACLVAPAVSAPHPIEPGLDNVQAATAGPASSRRARGKILALVPGPAGLEPASGRFHQLETTDALTGLMNRATLTALLAKSGAGPRSALMMLDLDDFGAINEAFGYGMGDACLKRVAERIMRNCRDADAVARLGGDEFAIVLGEVDDRRSLERIAGRLLAKMRKPLRCKGQIFRLGASIGVSLCTERVPGSQIADLFAQASMALHSAKRGGRNNFRFFDEEMQRAVKHRFASVRNIARALEADELELFYQPKIRLRDGCHAGFEALLRWRKPDGSVVAPGEFEDALSDPELSRKIGDFVIDAAIAQARQWHLARLPFNHIAINLSSSQFRDPKFAERLIGLIEAAGLRPQMIEVEVTEGVFLSQKAGAVQEALEKLMQSGVRIALDDFGTGFASLTHLRRFPVHTIKIDRSFVSRLLRHAEDHSIVQAIIFLARNLNLDVVAEGIEQEGERDFLRALGCDVGQGYLFGRPAPAAETTRRMSEPADPRLLVKWPASGRSVVQLR